MCSPARNLLSASLLLATATVANAQASTAGAIEFYHSGFDHYFVTASADEIGKLDSGYFRGWARTGYSFKVFPAEGAAPAGTTPVCRFYGRPEYGLDSHFYSASPAECAAVRANAPVRRRAIAALFE